MTRLYFKNKSKQNEYAWIYQEVKSGFEPL